MTTEFSLKFIFEFMPNLDDLPSTIFGPLANKMEKHLDKFPHINGIFLLSTTQQQPIIYSKQLHNFQKIKEVADLVGSFDLDYLIKNLGSRGYHGTDVVSFPDFGLGLIKLNDSDILAILTGSSTEITNQDYVKQVTGSIRSTLFERAEQTLRSMPNPTKSSVKNAGSSKIATSIPKPKKD